ncbi:M55 family metallopeptidase [Candidatus Aminicenantes bacterium AC-335-K20]|jgi:D-amino peptidase|nr:M55 family metallopeptidase [SCandidatus Aminicenantes bacterium Aminicenantia_JdfR_composite]MCP2619599.1 M55 family metallopeptidase [Candidatus Aminicenantes bacterium AC-335-K20]
MNKKLIRVILIFVLLGFCLVFNLSAKEKTKPKIYISVDMEGIGDIVTSAQLGPGKFEYERGRKFMTAEVNAAIEGCLEAGAGEIVVADSHGNAQSLIPEELNKSAFLIRGFPRGLLQMEGIDSSYDGVIFIGYHAKEGTPNANLSHTIWGSKFSELKINGKVVSEAIFNASVAGHFGVPIIMVAGDQNVVKEALAEFGNIETVITKESLGYYSAKFRHPELICQEIKEKCKKAVQRIKEFKPYVIKPPIRMELTFKHTYDAEAFSYLPWVKRIGGKTILVEADNILDINRFITAVFSINNK